jgi:hypothetical protein
MFVLPLLDAETSSSGRPNRGVVRSVASHSVTNAGIIASVKAAIKGERLSAHVDCVEDTHLDRTAVNSASADWVWIRTRYGRTLLFGLSPSSPASRWMPGVLGYFDRFRSRYLADMPIVPAVAAPPCDEEHGGLYPWLPDVTDVAGPHRLGLIRRGATPPRPRASTDVDLAA